MSLIKLLDGKDVLVGVIDVASDDVETPEHVADVIGEAMKYVAKEKIVPCTNCGMAPMRREIANAKLQRSARVRSWRGRSTAEPRAPPPLETGRSACEASRVGIIFALTPTPTLPLSGGGSAAERAARE